MLFTLFRRFRKNFAQLLEEDTTSNDRFAPQQPDKKEDEGDKKKAKKAEAKKKKKVVNYISAQAPPSTKPIRHFCAVCGFNDRLYTCVVCGMKYCSLTCQETHRDTRCLKYTSESLPVEITCISTESSLHPNTLVLSL